MYLPAFELFYLSLAVGFLVLVLCAVLVTHQLIQVLEDVKKITGDVAGATGDVTAIREGIKAGGFKVFEYIINRFLKGGAR